MSAQSLQKQQYMYNPQTYVVEKHMSKLDKATLILTHPKRQSYDENEFNKYNLQREEITIWYDGKRILLSIFNHGVKTEKILLFLHSNAGSKKQGIQLLKYLPKNLSIAMFDFFGCGNNQQSDFVTLGYDESKQADAVINYLKEKQYKIYVWGFFTGAVAALLSGQGNVIVADSAFTTFKEYLQQRSQHHSKFCCCFNPCWFGYLFKKVRSKVRKMAGYDVNNLDAKQAVKHLNPQTVLVLISRNQKQIMSKRNSEQLYELFPGEKKILKVYQGSLSSNEWDQLIKQIIGIIIQGNQEQPININPRLLKKSSSIL